MRKGGGARSTHATVVRTVAAIQIECKSSTRNSSDGWLLLRYSTFPQSSSPASYNTSLPLTLYHAGAPAARCTASAMTPTCVTSFRWSAPASATTYIPACVTPIAFASWRDGKRHGLRSTFASPYKYACRSIRQASTTSLVERSCSARDSTPRAADPRSGTPTFLCRRFRRIRIRSCSGWGSILGYRFWMLAWRCTSTI